MLEKGVPGPIPKILENVAIDVIPNPAPLTERGRKGAPLGQADPSVECHPAHQTRIEKLLWPAADLPHARIPFVPVTTDPIDQASQGLPEFRGDGVAVLVVEIDRVHQLAVDVELELGPCGIPDAHRGGSHIPLEVRKHVFW
jgi:hypothetical protein